MLGTEKMKRTNDKMNLVKINCSIKNYSTLIKKCREIKYNS